LELPTQGEEKRLKAKARTQVRIEIIRIPVTLPSRTAGGSPPLRFFDVQLHKWRLVPAAGGITSLSFSFSPVMIVATLFIDVTVVGHDIPGGRNESSLQSGDVGCSPYRRFILFLLRVILFVRDMIPIFATTFLLFSSSFMWNQHFPLSFIFG